MIIFGLILITLNQAQFFDAARAVLKIGLKPETKPLSGNLACPNL
jgi:hypothetical protein